MMASEIKDTVLWMIDKGIVCRISRVLIIGQFREQTIYVSNHSRYAGQFLVAAWFDSSCFEMTPWRHPVLLIRSYISLFLVNKTTFLSALGPRAESIRYNKSEFSCTLKHYCNSPTGSSSDGHTGKSFLFFPRVICTLTWPTFWLKS